MQGGGCIKKKKKKAVRSGILKLEKNVTSCHILNIIKKEKVKRIYKKFSFKD